MEKTNFKIQDKNYECPVCSVVAVNSESVLCASAGATNDPFEEVDWTKI